MRFSWYRPRGSVVEVEANGDVPPRRRGQQRLLHIAGAVVRLGIFPGVARPDFQIANAERERRVLCAHVARDVLLWQRVRRREFTEAPELTILEVAPVRAVGRAVDDRAVVRGDAARLVGELCFRV